MFRNVALTGILAIGVVLAGCGKSPNESAEGAAAPAAPAAAPAEAKPASSAAPAAKPGSLADANPVFAGMDTNNDNKVSRNEYVAIAKVRFKRFDKNKDNVVVAKEMPEGSSPETFRSMDKNKNGKLTLEEMVAAYEVQFPKLDKNKDGFLGPDEVPHTKAAE